MAIEIKSFSRCFFIRESDESKATILLLSKSVFRDGYPRDLSTVFKQKAQVIFIVVIREAANVNSVFALDSQS